MHLWTPQMHVEYFQNGCHFEKNMAIFQILPILTYRTYISVCETSSRASLAVCQHKALAVYHSIPEHSIKPCSNVVGLTLQIVRQSPVFLQSRKLWHAISLEPIKLQTCNFAQFFLSTLFPASSEMEEIH